MYIGERVGGTRSRTEGDQPPTLRGPAELVSLLPGPFSLPDEGLWDILIKDIPKEVTSYTFSMDILKQGVSYDFRVIAVNDYGYGTPSTPSPSVSGSLGGSTWAPLVGWVPALLFSHGHHQNPSPTLPGSCRAPNPAASSMAPCKTSCSPHLTHSLMWIQVS